MYIKNRRGIKNKIMGFSKVQARHQIIAIVVLLYLVPLTILCAVPLFHEGTNPEWISFPLGMLLTCFGSLTLFAMLGNDRKPQENPTPPAPEVVAPMVVVEKDDTEKEAIALLLQEKEEELARANEEAAQLLIQIESHQRNQTQQQEEISYRNEEMQKLTQERDHSKHQHEMLKEEFEIYKEKSLEQLEQEKQQANSLQEAISDLRTSVENKQGQIELLENKIHDLTYEIKTLLQLADMKTLPNEPVFDTAHGTLAEGFVINEVAHNYQVDVKALQEEKVLHNASQQPHQKEHFHEQLKRCIDIAQKITGSHHLAGYNSRFRDLGMDSYTLDLRRLCDNLGSENSYTVFVFSPKENKLLFVNNQIKELLGWSPEKFQQDFSNIVKEGMGEWKESLSHLNAHSHTQARLLMKKKTGQDLLIQCHLGLIPTGVFRNNIIGVLHQPA